ncbi:MAG TPA: DUF4173 domain-containing protein [Candidatus Dormibacteraeota bacterium]
MSDDTAVPIGRLSADKRWRWDGTTWRPATDGVGTAPVPAWMSLKLRSGATWTTVVAVLVVGLIADQFLRAGTVGIGASLTFAAAAAALIFAGRIMRLEARLLAAAAVLFGTWLSLRASPWLLVPDIGAAIVLLGVAASVAMRGSVLDLGIAEGLARGFSTALHGIAGAEFIARPITRSSSRISALAPVMRGLVIAIPIAVVLAVLLASADPIFASFFSLSFDFGRLALDVVFVLVGSLVMAGLLRLAAAEAIDRVDGPTWRLGTTEAVVVLAVLNSIFAAFAIAQAIAASGTGADTLRSAGITYADYARSGFFQLLWVAGIALVVLVLFSRVTGFAHRAARITFLALAEGAIALTLLIVLVASERLTLYEDAYGFTMLRLYSHVFAGLIAVVFLLLAADLAGFLPRRRWFVGASAICGLALLVGLNVANPEAIVVGLNIDRANQTHTIDAQYFAELSSDATSALLTARSNLDPALWPDVEGVACSGPRTYSPYPAAFNWADADAARARHEACRPAG